MCVSLHPLAFFFKRCYWCGMIFFGIVEWGKGSGVLPTGLYVFHLCYETLHKLFLHCCWDPKQNSIWYLLKPKLFPCKNVYIIKENNIVIFSITNRLLGSIFSSTGRRPVGLLSWRFVRHVCVLASISFFLDRDHISWSIWTKLAWSVYGHKISDEFDNERNLPSISRVIGPERLKIAVFNLVSAIETTFLNQSRPKMHKVFIGTRSWMSSIMSEICPVKQKLFAFE